MIYMWFTGMNYYELAVEKESDFIFTTIWKPAFISIFYVSSLWAVFPSVYQEVQMLQQLFSWTRMILLLISSEEV